MNTIIGKTITEQEADPRVAQCEQELIDAIQALAGHAFPQLLPREAVERMVTRVLGMYCDELVS